MNPLDPFPDTEDDQSLRQALRESRDQLRQALQEADGMTRELFELNRKLLQAEQVKTRFLALMRNEINNPLNDIMGLADRIEDPSVAMTKARELATMVKAEAFQLDRQIRNIFCVAELEEGQASPYFTGVDVGALVRDVLESFGPSARAKGLALGFHQVGDTSFRTDGGKLHHIVANLVANAVQFSGPSGSVSVRATADGYRLRIQVEDQGIGIAEAGIKAIFEPFHPQEGPYKTQHGQGLGLPVVKALVDILGGDLLVDSEPGRGSIFQVSLPGVLALDPMGAVDADGNLLIFDDPQVF